MLCSKQHRSEARIVAGTNGRADKSGRIHHLAQVGRALLNRRNMVDRVRQPRPELVIQHALTALSLPRQRLARARVGPEEVQVPKPRRDHNQPPVTRTETLECDALPSRTA